MGIAVVVGVGFAGDGLPAFVLTPGVGTVVGVLGAVVPSDGLVLDVLEAELPGTTLVLTICPSSPPEVQAPSIKATSE